MINKKRFFLVNKITLIVFFILIIILSIRFTFSSYEGNVDGKVVSDIAFYLLEAGSYSESLKMFEVEPDGNNYIFNVDVSNYKDNTRSDVDLEYELSLVTTTNLPIDYQIYLGDDTTNIISKKEVFQDEDMMYFNRYMTSTRTFSKDRDMVDKYKIVINFPKEYNDSKYQDLLDSVEVVIESRQV